VTLAVCPTGNITFNIHPPDRHGLARISIGRGEVVDGGMLIIFDVPRSLYTPAPGRSGFFAIVRPYSGPLPDNLNDGLKARIISRPMTTFDPLPPAFIARVCEQQRQDIKASWLSSLGINDSALCHLLRQQPGGASAHKQK